MKTGQAGWSAVEPMYVGETASLRFAISRGPQTPLEDWLGEKAVQTANVKVSMKMLATLKGTNFEVSPTSPQIIDLSAGGGSWAWDIKALAGQKHTVEVSVSAIIPNGDGVPSPTAVRVFKRDIKVKVRASEGAKGLVHWLTDFSADLTGLMKALVILIPLVGGVWLAVRKFGKPTPANPKP